MWNKQTNKTCLSTLCKSEADELPSSVSLVKSETVNKTWDLQTSNVLKKFVLFVLALKSKQVIL